MANRTKSVACSVASFWGSSITAMVFSLDVHMIVFVPCYSEFTVKYTLKRPPVPLLIRVKVKEPNPQNVCERFK